MPFIDPPKPKDAAIRSSLTDLTDQRQDTIAYAFEPPTYDEAIGCALDPTGAIKRNVRPVPCDELQGAEAYDMEDEQDYEESRPLRTGVVPNALSQYTFIQPQDHTLHKWWRQSKSHSQKYHYYMSTEQSFSGYKRDRHHCQTPVQTLGAPLTTSASGPSTQGPYASPSYCPQPYAEASGIDTPTTLEDLPPIGAKESSATPSFPTTTLHAPPNVSPALLIQSPMYQCPAEPFAGIPVAYGNRGLMNAQDISIADFVRKSSCDESVDPILENDPYQLYRYFVAHNDRPEMYLLITGYHVERHSTVSTDSKGKRTTSTREENVEDFRIEFDLTPFVNAKGMLHTFPDPKTGRERTLRQVFDEHARDDNEFKELHMKKAVEWDYDELTRAIIHAVRSAHYRFNVEVSFPLKNDRVKVASSSPLAKFMRNPWTKAFCFLGVVGVVFYPLRECFKRVRKESIKSCFEMTLSTREFYQANYRSIVDQVRYK